MCLNPLSIRNPTKVINNRGGQLLNMQVPCGVCAQCLQAKRNEWYVRTHYEMQRTFSLGGYVYFDTLTYADEHLPKLSHFVDLEKYDLKDFSCFNHRHFKLFLKRLRRLISYHFGISKDAFRYFLTTEYGEDDRYTHRPHYHILFFVYADIEPLQFSQLVADSWQYGRTDGYPFKPATYVYKHIYGRDNGFGVNTDFPTTSAVAMYVSKYITKSSTFCKKLEKRIKSITDQVYHYSLNHRVIEEEDKEMIKTLRRNIDMFHRQSKGFGLSYLDELTPEKLMFMELDQMTMKDKDKVVKTYPLPMYYKRKLFYNLKKHEDGSLYWELSENGLNHVLDNKLRKVDKTVLKYMDIVRNCSNEELKNKFFKLLGDRDISDYVIYEQYYKGRHRHIKGINYKVQSQTPLTDEEVNLHDWMQSLRDGMRPYHCIKSIIHVDEKMVRTPILKEEELEPYALDRYGHGSHMISNSHSDTLADYVQRYTFNEFSDPAFRDFDKLAVLIQQMTYEQRNDEQVTFDYLENLKAKFKTIFKNVL